MELNSEIFIRLINEKLLPDIIASYAMEKAIDGIISKFKNRSRSTLEEQLSMCISDTLELLCQKYVIEYNVETFEKIVRGLVENREYLSEKTFRIILRDAIDLDMDETVFSEWMFLINKVIAEEKLEILRDFILMQQNISMKQRVEKAYPRLLTAKPALAPEEYLDREEKKIVLRKLEENKKLVLVNGIGGIGKSTVCRKIYHELAEQSDRTLAWIVYGKDLKEDFKKQLFFPKEGINWEKNFIKFFQQDIEKEAIVFIDNLDVSEEEEAFLQIIANANCNVICTSRIDKYQHYEVVPVNFFTIDECVTLFYQYYKLEYDYKRIAEIVTRAGCHTLVIEILGKIGKAEGYTLQELQDKLDDQGFDLEGIASVDMKEDTLIGHLCRTFSISKLNHEQKEILYCLAVLPAQRIPLKLKRWLKLSNSYNVNYLAKYAWFVKDEKGFYMHPVIKEVVKRMIEPQQTALRRLVFGLEDELSFHENPPYEESMMLISYVESILPFLDNGSVNAQLFYNISMLYGQFGVYNKALDYIADCIDILERQNVDLELLGSAYNHQGYGYYYLFQDEKAEESYKKAYSIRKKLGKKKLLAQTISNLALLYQGMWKENADKDRNAERFLELSVQYQQEAIEIFEDIFSGKTHPNLASAYNNMAESKNSLQKFKEAEDYFKKAEAIRLHLSDETAAGDLSVTYLGMGKNYYDMAEKTVDIKEKKRCLRLALDYTEKCRNIRISEIRKGNQKLGIEIVDELQKKIEGVLKEYL